MGPGEKLKKVDGASMTWGSFRLVTNIYLSSGVSVLTSLSHVLYLNSKPFLIQILPEAAVSIGKRGVS